MSLVWLCSCKIQGVTRSGGTMRGFVSQKFSRGSDSQKVFPGIGSADTLSRSLVSWCYVVRATQAYHHHRYPVNMGNELLLQRTDQTISSIGVRTRGLYLLKVVERARFLEEDEHCCRPGMAK